MNLRLEDDTLAIRGQIDQRAAAPRIKVVLGDLGLSLSLVNARHLLRTLQATVARAQSGQPGQPQTPCACESLEGVPANCHPEECPYLAARRACEPGLTLVEICRRCLRPVVDGMPGDL